MQKLDLRNHIKYIIDLTKSQQIVDKLEIDNQIDKLSLINLMIESKSGFDKESINQDKQKILNEFGADKYYKSEFFGRMLDFISANNRNNYNQYLRDSRSISDFFSFHNTLLVTFKLIDNLLLTQKELFENEGEFSLNKLTNKGILILQVVNDKPVPVSQLSKITLHLDKLLNAVIEFIEKINGNKFDTNPQVILLDSGSDFNIGIKIPPEISKSISKILDDCWEYLTNPSGYRLKKADKNLRTALSIVEQIDKAEKESKIGKEEAEKWKRQITESASEIIINNTITKQKAIDYTEISNRKILLENSQKLLEGGRKEE